MSIETSRGILGNSLIWEQLDPSFRERVETDRLDELLIPNPQAAAEEIFRRIQESEEGTVNTLYSLSMFSGKTRAAIRLGKILEIHGIPVIAVQPSNAIRFGEAQESEMMTHQLQNPENFPAVKTTTNFGSILEIVKVFEDESFQGKKVVIIDEGMFFVDHIEEPKEAEETIEEIRETGIHVVITGITRTYKTTPFVVMDHLVEASSRRNNWDSIQMSTQCAFCLERAKGTARYIVNDSDTRLAPYDDSDILPGSGDYL